MLVVGQTGCDNKTFVQKLGVNNMFGKLKDAEWISKIELSKGKVKNINLSFKDPFVNFHYPANIFEFPKVILNLQRKKDENETDNDSAKGVDNIVLRIAMNNVYRLSKFKLNWFWKVQNKCCKY